jgi:hypothetical protein
MYQNENVARTIEAESEYKELAPLYGTQSRLYNGTYTLTNVATGEHRTFKIATQSADSRFAPGERVLSLLTGSNNETDYTGFAFVGNNDAIRVWRSKRGPDGKKSAYEYYACLISKVKVAPNENEDVNVAVEMCGRKYEVMVSKRCIRCNRKLTSPESIRTGIGPICAGR